MENKDLVKVIETKIKASSKDKQAMIERLENGDGQLKSLLIALSKRS